MACEAVEIARGMPSAKPSPDQVALRRASSTSEMQTPFTELEAGLPSTLLLDRVFAPP